jgi:hypothetical protein
MVFDKLQGYLLAAAVVEKKMFAKGQKKLENKNQFQIRKAHNAQCILQGSSNDLSACQTNHFCRVA